MKNIITEVINDYLNSKCMVNENFYNRCKTMPEYQIACLDKYRGQH